MRWLSLGILVASGVLLAAFWGDVPDRWVTHWGPHGPDGWAAKSFSAALAPLIIGLFTWLAFEVTAIWMAQRESKAELPPQMISVQVAVVRATGFAVSLLIAGITLALPFVHPRSPLPIVVTALVDLGLIVGGAMLWAARRTRRLRAAGAAIPEGYEGVFYRNPRDSRLWVPKVVGIGWTINFAHRFAWPMMIVLVGLPLAVVVLVGALAR